MASNAAETLIGAAVLLVAGGFLYFAGQSSGFTGSSGQYPLYAKFTSVEGLNVGSDVRMAGVKIGSLTGIKLDQETYQAVATISVNDDIAIPSDADIKVATEGLLGGSFLEITAGGSPFMLSDGEEIIMTQSSVSFLNLLLKFVTGNEE